MILLFATKGQFKAEKRLHHKLVFENCLVMVTLSQNHKETLNAYREF